MTIDATPHNRASELALEIYAKTLRAVRADRLVDVAVKRAGDVLFVQDRAFDLSHFDRVWIAGAGKASVPMAQALSAVLGDRLSGGLIVTKTGHSEPVPGIEVLEASHPLPDESSLFAGQKLLDFAISRKESDLVLFVLSGGASALVEALKDGIGLDALQASNRELLGSGKTIVQMNAVRSQFSRIKSGKLARAFEPATVVALVLSDVLGNNLASIGSGPLLDPDLRHQPIEHFVIGSVSLAMHEAADAAHRLGLNAMPFADPLQGEAALRAKKIAKYARDNGNPGSCLIFGGETTVTLSGSGLGGRCQEMALAAARTIAHIPNSCFLAGGTDGTDGPTDAAGGIVDPSSIERATAQKASLKKALTEHDSYHWLQASDGLIKTGPTGSNVNDIVLVVLADD